MDFDFNVFREISFFRHFEFLDNFRFWGRLPFVIFPFNFGNLVIKAFIAYLIYNDAEKRNMNGLIWALVAVLAPSLIGMVIYLLVRKNQTTSSSQSEPRCSTCNRPMSAEWKVCPYCKKQLDEV